jgi:RNA methyltransferase, TrmH family
MLSKSRITFIHSLKQKKFRELHRQFTAEGSKLVLDLAGGFHHIREVFALSSWIREFGHIPEAAGIPVTGITETEMARITALSTPSPVLAVADIPADLGNPAPVEGLTLLLDDIRDPGNLGTIIRIADWFGISQVVCSETTVDLYNPKTIQSTMGSFSRVRVHYTDPVRFLASAGQERRIYGTFLDGDNIYTRELTPDGIIVIGNESEGISGAVGKMVTDRVFIPGFAPVGGRTGSAESLNASVAAAVVCSEFRRRVF